MPRNQQASLRLIDPALQDPLRKVLLLQLGPTALGRLACVCRALRQTVEGAPLGVWRRIASVALFPGHSALLGCEDAAELHSAVRSYVRTVQALKKGLKRPKRQEMYLPDPCLSPDGNILAAPQNDGLLLYRTDSVSTIAGTLPLCTCDHPADHRVRMQQLQWFSDSRRVTAIYKSGHEHFCVVFDCYTGTHSTPVHLPGSGASLVAGGHLIMLPGCNSSSIMDLQSCSTVRLEQPLSTTDPGATSWLPQRKRVATYGGSGMIQVMHLQTGQLQHTFQAGGSLGLGASSADGRLLFYTRRVQRNNRGGFSMYDEDRSCNVVDLNSGRLILNLGCMVGEGIFLPQNRFCCLGNSTGLHPLLATTNKYMNYNPYAKYCQIWDLTSYKRLTFFNVHDDCILGCAAPDGKFICLTSYAMVDFVDDYGKHSCELRGYAHIYAVETGLRAAEIMVEDRILKIAWHPDGTKLIISCEYMTHIVYMNEDNEGLAPWRR